MDAAVFKKACKIISRNHEMEEDEMTLTFDKAGFFNELGYKTPGIDLRSQKTLKESGTRPDRFCRDNLGNTIFVFEGKRPSDTEFEIENPMEIKWVPELLSKYIIPLKTQYGILTNGIRFILFERVGTNIIPIIGSVQKSLLRIQQSQ